MLSLFKQRSIFEAIFAGSVTLFFCIFVTFVFGLSLKFQIAFVLALGFFTMLAILPQRRTLCLCLWVLIQPLSIEKIVFTATPFWEGVSPWSVAINIADVLLLALLAILVLEKANQPKTHKLLVWDKGLVLAVGMFVWAICSYLLHLGFFQSDFLASVPIGLEQLLMNLLFIAIMSASIKTKSDLIWILITLALMLAIQSLLVGLAYITGEPYNFSRLLGQATKLQAYTNGSEIISRASGTLGPPNSQAIYHTASTLLLLALVALKNPLLKSLGVIVILASFTAVLLTFSRGAWLSIALASVIIIAIFVYRREVKPQAWLFGSVIAIFAAIFLAIISSTLLDRLTKGDAGATGSRIRMIMLAKDLFLQYPLTGVGANAYVEAGLKLYPPGKNETEWVPLGETAIVPPLGRIEMATAKKADGSKDRIGLPVHNKFMLILSETGIVGLLLWLLFLKYYLTEAIKCSLSEELLYRYIGVAGIATIIALSIYMLIDLFYGNKMMQIVFFPMIFVSAAYRISQQNTLRRACLNIQ